MKIYVHMLGGCAPTPLAHYLKALGVMRLVAEQVDPRVRGFWRDGCFHLATTLTLDDLLSFFLSGYAPSPLVAPWNGGSGFYPKDNQSAVEAIAKGAADRFALYKEGIQFARQVVGQMQERPADHEKRDLIATCRAEWPDSLLRWLDAALVLGDDDVRYPALLGTGGNDGRLDFTNNQMQRLVELFDPGSGAPSADARSLLESALLRRPTAALAAGKAIGQFHPGAAGGANGTSSYDAGSLLNPWDYVLALEGALQFRVAATRRLSGAASTQAAAPFAVRARSAGYGSAAGGVDESARGEQWMPLWSGASTVSEVTQLFAEARFQSGRSRAQSALDAAIAVTRVGVTRGVTAFARYGYIERNGQSNLAVPLGMWHVPATPAPEPVDTIAQWLDRVRRVAGADGAPAHLARDVRSAESALMEVLHRGSAERWQALLIALGRAEASLVSRPRLTGAAKNLTPVPPLDLSVIELASDGSAEFRLALSMASIRSFGGARTQGTRRGADTLGPLRRHFLPLEPASGWSDFARSSDVLRRDPEVCWQYGDFVSDTCNVLNRRLRLGRSDAFDGIYPARLDDISGFVRGEMDEQRMGALVPALMALKWSDAPLNEENVSVRRVDSLFACVRVAYLPRRLLAPGLDVVVDPGPLRRLSSGSFRLGIAAALARLGAMGIRTVINPRIHHLTGTPEYARRLAASLAFPISQSAARFLLSAVGRIEQEAQS